MNNGTSSHVMCRSYMCVASCGRTYLSHLNVYCTAVSLFGLD